MVLSRDLQCLRQEAKENIKKYVDEKLPEEYEKTLCGLDSILREAWSIEIKALSLAKDCYSMKLELLTNATVVEDAIRFVQSNRNSPVEIVESASRTANETERKKEKNGFLPQSNAAAEVTTVNKVF